MAFLFFCILVGNGQNREQKNMHFSHLMETYTNSYDGKTYKVIVFILENTYDIIEKTWCAKNLRFEAEGSKVCYDTEEYAKIYGRIYNYEQANTTCPEERHVPSIHERHHFFDGCHHSGKYLKEGRESNIDMLFGGLAQPDRKYEELGDNGNFWGNELMNLNSARIITLKRNDENIYHSKEGDAHYLSC